MRVSIFFFFTVFLAFSQGKIPELSWDKPEDWKLVETGRDFMPWLFLTPDDQKVSLFRYESQENDIWLVCKVWRNSLQLPILTKEELAKEQKKLNEELIYVEFKSSQKTIFGAFYRKNEALWALRYESTAEKASAFKGAFQKLALSLKENPGLEKYIEELKQSAAAADQVELADYYLQGYGVKKSTDEALKYLNKAHESGSADATYKLALLELKKKNIAGAINFLDKNISKRHLPSIKKLAGLLLENPRSTDKAISLLKMAAEEGDQEAMYYLGSLYYSKKEFENREKAVKWISMAAAKEHKKAIRTLGLFYKNGHGVEMDLEKGINLLKKAAEKGDVIALENLGTIYLDEKFGRKNLEKAVHYLSHGASRGGTNAMVSLSQLYFKGEGVEQNKDLGFKLLEKAARAGNSGAMVLMGNIFAEGKLSRKNLELAFNFYNMAAARKNEEGMFRVGVALCLGRGCSKDLAKGVKWLEQAALRGHKGAAMALKEKKSQ